MAGAVKTGAQLRKFRSALENHNRPSHGSVSRHGNCYCVSLSTSERQSVKLHCHSECEETRQFQHTSTSRINVQSLVLR